MVSAVTPCSNALSRHGVDRKAQSAARNALLAGLRLEQPRQLGQQRRLRAARVSCGSSSRMRQAKTTLWSVRVAQPTYHPIWRLRSGPAPSGEHLEARAALAVHLPAACDLTQRGDTSGHLIRLARDVKPSCHHAMQERHLFQWRDAATRNREPGPGEDAAALAVGVNRGGAGSAHPTQPKQRQCTRPPQHDDTHKRGDQPPWPESQGTCGATPPAGDRGACLRDASPRRAGACAAAARCRVRSVRCPRRSGRCQPPVRGTTGSRPATATAASPRAAAR